MIQKSLGLERQKKIQKRTFAKQSNWHKQLRFGRARFVVDNKVVSGVRCCRAPVECVERTGCTKRGFRVTQVSGGKRETKQQTATDSKT